MIPFRLSGGHMNINLCVQCDECSRKTNCRVGMSNRDIQPLKFSCKGCGSIIALDFHVPNANTLDNRAVEAMLAGKGPKGVRVNQGVSHRVSGATEIPIERGFDPAFDFVDLHLDFPVVFGEYVMGFTPFLQASQRAGAEATQFHRLRLGLINEHYKKYPQVTKLIGMFSKGFYGPFRETARKRFKVVTKSNNLEDINATLYTVISEHVLPFTLPDDNQQLVLGYSGLVMSLAQSKRPGLVAFLQELFDTGFLASLQRDCLKIYGPILNAELPLRPALFLDLDPSYAEGTTAMRVSSQDFDEYREVYKDMAEVLSRQLVLVAGLNNLLKRGDHNSFAERKAKSGKNLAPASLQDYADVSLGGKLVDLDDPWIQIDPAAMDNALRNAIAHNKIDYDEISQAITYYPKLEGMEGETERQIQLLDYMRRMLVLFRQVHRLHHLVKCLNYALLLEPLKSLIKRDGQGA